MNLRRLISCPEAQETVDRTGSNEARREPAGVTGFGSEADISFLRPWCAANSLAEHIIN
jgi:hypothetical protein